MNVFAEAICPLCSQVKLREHLYSSMAGEHPHLRAKIIQIIRAYHEGWMPEDGACEPCWKSFRDAGRILNVLKQTQPSRPGQAWNNRLRPIDESHDGTEQSSFYETHRGKATFEPLFGQDDGEAR